MQIGETVALGPIRAGADAVMFIIGYLSGFLHVDILGHAKQSFKLQKNHANQRVKSLKEHYLYKRLFARRSTKLAPESRTG